MAAKYQLRDTKVKKLRQINTYLFLESLKKRHMGITLRKENPVCQPRYFVSKFPLLIQMTASLKKKLRNLPECIQAHHPTALTSQSPETLVHPHQPIKKKIALPSGVVVKNNRIGMSISTPSVWKACFILMYLEKINGG